ncbi:hypothetical protein LUZ60_000848 [Juncus effusus]|nr:hypothetical protein LUZ60_000848 [Juncus effusus]
MAAKAASSSGSASKSQASSGVNTSDDKAGISSARDILSVIDSLKKQITADRFSSIKEKIEANKQKLRNFTQHTQNLSKLRKSNALNSADSDSSNLLTKRQTEAILSYNTLELSNGDNTEDSSCATSAVLLGGNSNSGGKNAIKAVKFPEIPKLPPYTTWIFLDRNQRMSEDQSVVGRRRIYYDRNSEGEALICSDSEDELVDDEEEKKEFKKTEDHIIRMTIRESGLSETALDVLAKCFKRTPDEIKARYEALPCEKAEESVKKEIKFDIKLDDAILEKDLDAALDSFDNLFCRRCLVFDCRLHGCSQDLVFPVEKQQSISNLNDDSPCGPHCYKLVSETDAISDTHENLGQSSNSGKKKKTLKKKIVARNSKQTELSESSSSAKLISESTTSSSNKPSDENSETIKQINNSNKNNNNKRAAERVLASIRKRQKESSELENNNSNGEKDCISRVTKRKKSSSQKGSESFEMCKDSLNESSKKDEFFGESLCKQVETSGLSWKPIEQGLFVKGLLIFGRNSCLIARNLLNGIKTCKEVSQYMTFNETNKSDGTQSNLVKGHLNGMEMRARSRFVRRRGRVRRLKYTWKSTGYHHSIRKKTTEKKDQPYKQYNPCGCQSACGKLCPCHLNGTCCEKYCGCAKICKNRFRGCHCAKSQCRSRQCPCFAADRECDPDVCRNCWVGCGDGTLGGPNQRGDNYECRNMKLLLKQQQRVLLGRSDVSGWGAFLKNSVGKHEYLGEYTGELISHREADKRGKIYDRENSSFLFNLNDQFVLDAYRMGDKLKFANHSPDPNCYAKVIMVAGDHRVGIFAKERISAGEELFYDYRYEPDRAPVWARKPDSGLKDDNSQPSTGGRAKKQT